MFPPPAAGRRPARSVPGLPAASSGATNSLACRSQMFALAPVSANRSAIGSPSGNARCRRR